MVGALLGEALLPARALSGFISSRALILLESV